MMNMTKYPTKVGKMIMPKNKPPPNFYVNHHQTMGGNTLQVKNQFATLSTIQDEQRFCKPSEKLKGFETLIWLHEE